MPELPDRMKNEKELATALVVLFRLFREEFAAGNAPSFFTLAAELTDAIRSSLGNTFGMAARGLAGANGVGGGGGNDGGGNSIQGLDDRANGYASTVAALLAMKITNDVRFASPRMTMNGGSLNRGIIVPNNRGIIVPSGLILPASQQRTLVDSLLSDNRAQNIAITETTRAISTGEDYGAAAVMALTQALATWFWEIEDEAACEFCKSYDGQERPDIEPPGHPGCRCRKRWIFSAR